MSDRGKIIAEKVMTKMYAELCDSCKKKFAPRIVDLARETAEEVTREIGI